MRDILLNPSTCFPYSHVSEQVYSIISEHNRYANNKWAHMETNQSSQVVDTNDLRQNGNSFGAEYGAISILSSLRKLPSADLCVVRTLIDGILSQRQSALEFVE
ncbi:MAG: hypothetical protein LBU65_12955 [Planctomycetaceae bacterium]|nr:hypothetical protein [Planctomycetaceae bacterium]